MKIAHFSDLHGDYNLIGDIEKPDLWICTGDFMPNFTSPIIHKKIRLETERNKQFEWFSKNLQKINKMLRNVPIFWTNGNHDFIKPFGINRLLYIEEGIYGEFNGLKFAGFPEIPIINGNWNGEVGFQEMIRICKNVFSESFHVLITHTPPKNILDNLSYHGYENVGSEPLETFIFNSNIILHCFGHIHEQGGKIEKKDDIIFSNAATVFNIIEI